ncbi:hypothetical protein AAVH_17188 [Aphelenchoides avenae]|nr:hypothetical protein AAVH_17188 [Aphelenchus avenae]
MLPSYQHNRLQILLANILASYGIMFHTYRDGCDLVVPPWMIAIVRGSTFSYATAFPMWHLALTLERLMATQRAKKYETAGVAFGIVASILVWMMSTGHTSFIVWSAYQDVVFQTGSAYLTLTTKTSASVILVRTYSIIVLDCATLVLDGIIAAVNRRKLKRYCFDVIKQMPSSVADSLFRQQGLFDMTRARQQAFLDLTLMVTLMQLPFSLLILLRFCQNLKRNVVIVDPKSESEVFFKQFQKQIGAADKPQRHGTGIRRIPRD